MEYVLNIVILVGLYVILSSSFNLIIGHGGLISIAHPIFYAIGAYCSALLSINFHVPLVLSILCGSVLAMLVSAAVALPSLRISGDYLLIASIGFQLGLLQVVEQLDFTGGPGGIGNIPSLVDGPQRSLLFAGIVTAIAVIVVLLIRALMNGDYGRAVRAMRDDELAFSMLGRRAMKIKLGIFAFGSGLAGLAGGLYAHYYQYVSPQQFGILQSSMILTMVVVGGMSSTLGPVIGAGLLVILPELIAFLNLPPSVMAPVQGILFTGLVLVFMFVRPQGIVGASTKRRSGLAEAGQGQGQ